MSDGNARWFFGSAMWALGWLVTGMIGLAISAALGHEPNDAALGVVFALASLGLAGLFGSLFWLIASDDMWKRK